MNLYQTKKRPYVFKQISSGRNHEYIAERLSPEMIRRMIAWMRSDMEDKESEYEDGILYCPGDVKYYLCMERNQNEARHNHTADVWILDMQTHRSQSLADNKRIVLLSEVLG